MEATREAKRLFSLAAQDLGIASLAVEDKESGITIADAITEEAWLSTMMWHSDQIGLSLVGERVFPCDYHVDLDQADYLVPTINEAKPSLSASTSEQRALGYLICRQGLRQSIYEERGVAYLRPAAKPPGLTQGMRMEDMTATSVSVLFLTTKLASLYPKIGPIFDKAPSLNTGLNPSP